MAVTPASAELAVSRMTLSHNGKVSKNPVLWPWALAYDLEIQELSCACRSTCIRNISTS